MAARFQHTGTQNLLRDAEGAFWGKTKVGGRRRMKKLRAEGLREARRELAVWLGSVQQAAAVRKRGRPKGSAMPTWGKAVGLWIKGIEKRPDLAPATLRYYNSRLPALLSLAPEKTAVDRITRAMASEWWQRTANAAPAHHANVALGAVRHIFADLKRSGHVTDDPTEGFKKMRLSQRRMSLPSAAELAAVIEEMGKSEGAAMVRFLAYSGVRISEAGRIQWSDIEGHHPHYTVTVRSAKARGRAEHYRRIPATPPLADLIREMWHNLAAANIQPKGPVFTIASPKTAFENAQKRAGVPHMRIHDLRHMFATRCIEAGVDVPTVSRWLGHSDGGALAMRTYGHLRDDHSRAQAQRVNF